MEDAISTFGFKSEVLIVTSIDGGHAYTEVKEIILSYPSITQVMVNSHCEILWADNYEAYLGRHPTEIYSEGLYDVEKQAIISQQRLRSKILGLWFNNSLATDYKRNLSYFRYSDTFNTHEDKAEMFFVIVKMV